MINLQLRISSFSVLILISYFKTSKIVCIKWYSKLYRCFQISLFFVVFLQIDKTKDELTSMNWPQTFNIYVMLRNFVCRIGEDADLLMSLYDAKLGKFIRFVKSSCLGILRLVLNSFFNDLFGATPNLVLCVW